MAGKLAQHDAQIREWVSQGISSLKIGPMLGVHPVTVRSYCRTHGIQLQQHPTPVADALRLRDAYIRERVADRWSIDRVAEALGAAKTTLKQYCRDNDIHYPSKGGWQIGSVLDPHRDQIAEMAAQGATLQEIAGRFGVCPEAVWQFCRRNEIEHNRKRGWRYGSHTGEKHPRWNGGRVVSPEGYVWVKAPAGHPGANRAGYIREHRLVMERVIGRFLHPGEVVHHQDRNRANNDPSNLVLYDSNGQHTHDELTGRPQKPHPPFSEEHRRKIAEANRRRMSDPVVRARMSALHKGKTLSPETRMKLSQIALRRWQTPEYREKQASARQARRKQQQSGHQS